MKFRPLIESTQEIFLECDNETCDFSIPNDGQFSEGENHKFINMPCPKCGENLLTVEDYQDYERMMKVINWLNKWFSWITIFYRKSSKPHYAEMKVHKGVHVSVVKEKEEES